MVYGVQKWLPCQKTLLWSNKDIEWKDLKKKKYAVSAINTERGFTWHFNHLKTADPSSW
jgi:hypothetical protein